LKDFSHIGGDGKAKMVDVSGKPVSKRTAVAEGFVRMDAGTVESLRGGLMKKGDALATAKIAGIMGAKRTSDLIPLCHPLPVDDIEVDLELQEEGVSIISTVVSTARTGVEMEALTAVTIAALTIYDMCKAIDKEMSIGGISLKSKKKEEA
jgi:cyclic pyranopterin phosphate synthase